MVPHILGYGRDSSPSALKKKPHHDLNTKALYPHNITRCPRLYIFLFNINVQNNHNLSAINLYNKQLTSHFHIKGTLQTCKSVTTE